MEQQFHYVVHVILDASKEETITSLHESFGLQATEITYDTDIPFSKYILLQAVQNIGVALPRSYQIYYTNNSTDHSYRVVLYSNTTFPSNTHFLIITGWQNLDELISIPYQIPSMIDGPKLMQLSLEFEVVNQRTGLRIQKQWLLFGEDHSEIRCNYANFFNEFIFQMGLRTRKKIDFVFERRKDVSHSYQYTASPLLSLESELKQISNLPNFRVIFGDYRSDESKLGIDHRKLLFANQTELQKSLSMDTTFLLTSPLSLMEFFSSEFQSCNPEISMRFREMANQTFEKLFGSLKENEFRYLIEMFVYQPIDSIILSKLPNECDNILLTWIHYADFIDHPTAKQYILKALFSLTCVIEKINMTRLYLQGKIGHLQFVQMADDGNAYFPIPFLAYKTQAYTINLIWGGSKEIIYTPKDRTLGKFNTLWNEIILPLYTKIITLKKPSFENSIAMLEMTARLSDFGTFYEMLMTDGFLSIFYFGIHHTSFLYQMLGLTKASVEAKDGECLRIENNAVLRVLRKCISEEN